MITKKLTWDKVVPNPFYFVWCETIFIVQIFRLCKNRPLWVNADNRHPGNLFFQFFGNSGDGASCPNSSNDHVYFSTSLTEDFLCSCVIVCHWVVVVGVLVQNHAVWDLLVQSFSDTNVTFWCVPRSFRWCDHHFGSEGFQSASLFTAHFFRHGHDHSVSLDSSSQSKPESSISWWCFDQGGFPRFDSSRFFCLFYHSQCDAVFDRSSSAEILAFGKELAFDSFRLPNTIQLDQRSSSNMVEDVLHDALVNRLFLGGHCLLRLSAVLLYCLVSVCSFRWLGPMRRLLGERGTKDVVFCSLCALLLYLFLLCVFVCLLVWCLVGWLVGWLLCFWVWVAWMGFVYGLVVQIGLGDWSLLSEPMRQSFVCFLFLFLFFFIFFSVTKRKERKRRKEKEEKKRKKEKKKKKNKKNKKKKKNKKNKKEKRKEKENVKEEKEERKRQKPQITKKSLKNCALGSFSSRFDHHPVPT